MQSIFFEIIDNAKNILDKSGVVQKEIYFGILFSFLSKISKSKTLNMKVTSIILNVIIHFRTFMLIV